MKDRVTFYRGDETGYVLEKMDYTDSLFAEQYLYGLKLVAQLLAYPSNMSNVIAFCGDRGEGKTSCMLSFAHLLTSKEQRRALLNNGALDEFNPYVLDVIDPAFFDQKHNVIELIIGQMYGCLKEDIVKDHEDGNIYERNALLEKFHNAKASLAHLEKDRREMYDALEELSVLSAGVNLRKQVNELFAKFLSYNKKQKLVIVIDDLDLNMSEGYNMAEQIRKYLNNEHCIVLIGVNIGQLCEIVASSISKGFNKTDDAIVDFREMASKYVTKLLPIGHRINMPKANELFDCKVEIRNHNEETRTEVDNLRMVKDEVLRLIFLKTRYLFYNGMGKVCPLIPENLRNLRMLMAMLLTMDDFKNNTENAGNKRIFKDYFYGEWAKCLAKDDFEYISKLVQYTDVSAINKSVFNHLKSYVNKGNDKDVPLPLRCAELNETHYDYSVGDVLALLDTIEQVEVTRNVKQLVFFVRSFYSIMLYDLYDEISERERMLYPVTPNDSYEVVKEEEPFKSMNLLQKFLNGTYFAYNQGDVLPPSTNKKYRDICVINGKPLSEAMHDVKTWIDANEEDAWDDEKKKTFRTCEFFVLTTLHAIAQRDISNLHSLYIGESSVNPAFTVKYNPNTGYYVFDVMAPFYNLVNPQYAYERFAAIADMYEFAKNHEWSLLGQMLRYVREEDLDAERDSLHLLISDAVIRNAEIHATIMDQLKVYREKNRGSSNHRNLMAYMYRRIMNAGIKIYSFNERGNYDVKFVYLKALVDFLSENENELFDKIFDGDIVNYVDTISEGDQVLLRELFPSVANYRRYPISRDNLVVKLKSDYISRYGAEVQMIQWKQQVFKPGQPSYESWATVCGRLISVLPLLKDNLPVEEEPRPE